MPGVFIGSTELTAVGDIKIGSTDVQEVYVGATQIFPSGAPVTQFVSQWQTDNSGTSANDQITLPLVSSGTYNFDVDWGDGSPVDTITVFNDPAVTHTFIGGPGTFTVTITGTIDGWQFNSSGDRLKIIQISSWGPLRLGNNIGNHFFGCTELVITATDTLDLSGVVDMTQVFRNCRAMTALAVNGWDTSSATTMNGMFFDCVTIASLDLTSFDTSSVNDMFAMFNNCPLLASLDLTSFDVSNVTNFASFVSGCGSLTSLDVSGFVTSSATNISNMFNNCADLISLDLSSFVTTSVTLMQNLCNGCFDLTTLDVTSFNTSSVTNMSQMFRNCNSLTAIDVSGFNTSSATNMGQMFQSCLSLSVIDVSGFNTALVADMNFMFNGCTGISTLALDQAGWDIGLVTNLTNFCNNVTLDTANYDSILAAWAAQSPVQSGVTCSFGNSQYTIATSQANRDVLTDPPNSWNLTDGGGL